MIIIISLDLRLISGLLGKCSGNAWCTIDCSPAASGATITDVASDDRDIIIINDWIVSEFARGMG